MDTCGAADVVGDNTYLCTLDAGHAPDPGGTTITHQCVYSEPDPDNRPFARTGVHEWTVPVPGA